MRRVGVALGLVVGLAGCGGGGGGGGVTTPTTPAPLPPSGWPAGTVVELVDGETGAPVTRAQVLVAGSPVTVGAPLATAEPNGATVDVTAGGHLTRQTSVRTGESRLVLWPETPEYPGDYTKALVYLNDDGEEVPLKRMGSRVGTVALSPSAEIQADPAAIQAHREAAAAMSIPAVGISYVVGGAADFTVATRIEPGYSCCGDRTRACATTWLGSAGAITRAEIVFCSAEYSRSAGTTAHELGHTFGLRHSTDRWDLMYRYYSQGRSTEPTGREILTMAMMRQRRPGTVWPDNDRNAQAAAVRIEVIE
jgi:hypothetical protein